MRKHTTSERLKEIMATKRLRQADIIRLVQPYCQKYDVKLGKSLLNQYINGGVDPGQNKLWILGQALNVSEAWLMGYDVPMEREEPRTTRLRQLREEHGLSQTELAKILEISPETLSFFERGKGEVKATTLKEIADFFKCSVDYLLCRDEEAFTLSDHEKNLILAYRARPEMQGAVNTLLGITNGPSIAEDISSVIEEAAAFKTEPIESR